jgi:hypothetical protein
MNKFPQAFPQAVSAVIVERRNPRVSAEVGSAVGVSSRLRSGARYTGLRAWSAGRENGDAVRAAAAATAVTVGGGGLGQPDHKLTTLVTTTQTTIRQQ